MITSSLRTQRTTRLSKRVFHKSMDPYREAIDSVLTSFGADERAGLTANEARARLDRYGKNELATQKRVPRWRKFLEQFQDVLVVLLLVATVISAVLWLY